MLVDSHCHLDFADFGAEREAVIARARRAGVGGMLTICTKVSEFAAVRALAEAHDDIWCSVGIHPHEAASEPATDAATLAALADHPKVVGSASAGSTSTTTTARATARPRSSARMPQRRARLACRSSFTPATPTTRPRPSSPRRAGRAVDRRHPLLQLRSATR